MILSFMSGVPTCFFVCAFLFVIAFIAYSEWNSRR